MTVADFVFYASAAITLAGAAYAVFSRNLVRAVFALLATFSGVSVLYGMLASDFISIVQLMVYVGGILVLMLFAVMLTSRIESVKESNRAGGWLVGGALGLGCTAVLGHVAWHGPWRVNAVLPAPRPLTASIGDWLMGPGLLPFCTVGLILLGSVIGAVTLARRPGHGSGGSAS